MITKNHRYKCDYCGHFISYDDLRSGSARISMISHDSECSVEEFETVCKNCNEENPDV